MLIIGLIILFAVAIDEASLPRKVTFTFILPITFLTILLIRVCYRKAEKPKWEWKKYREISIESKNDVNNAVILKIIKL